MAVLKLSRNAPERHTGSFWKGGTPYRNFWRRSAFGASPLAFRHFFFHSLSTDLW